MTKIAPIKPLRDDRAAGGRAGRAALRCAARSRYTMFRAFFLPAGSAATSNETRSPIIGRAPPFGKAEMCANNSPSPISGVTKPKPRSSFHFVNVPSNLMMLVALQLRFGRGPIVHIRLGTTKLNLRDPSNKERMLEPQSSQLPSVPGVITSQPPRAHRYVWRNYDAHPSLRGSAIEIHLDDSTAVAKTRCLGASGQISGTNELPTSSSHF